MERAGDASNKGGKYKTRKSPVQRWRPISTDAVSKEANLEESSDIGSKQVVENCTTTAEYLAPGGANNVFIEVVSKAASASESSFTLESSTAGIAIEEEAMEVVDLKKDLESSTAGIAIEEEAMEVVDLKKDLDMASSAEKHFSSVEVDAPLMRFLKGKGGSMQKEIEEETGVKIIFPSSKEETRVVFEGNTVESVTKASEKVTKVLEQAVKSPMLDYSHFISLPLAIHPDLVGKLNHFQSSILANGSSNVDIDKDEELNEGSSDEVDQEDVQAASPSVSVKMEVEEEREQVRVKVDTKGYKSGSEGSTLSDLGIDKSIFIKPKTFHLTVLMLKLWNKDRVAMASEVLQSVSSQVKDALGNRPISIQLRGLTCMKGSPSRARVLYAPVLEVGGEGRLVRACKVITDAFVESGLVLDRDAKHELKLHATVMNVRHRKRKRRDKWRDSFDARNIFSVYGQQEWGEYLLPEVHLSQRFKFDESGYYHCCSSIALPVDMQTE